MLSEKWHFGSGRQQFQETTMVLKYSNLVNKSGFIDKVCVCKSMSRCTNKKMWKSPWDLYGQRTTVGIDYLSKVLNNRQLCRDVIKIDAFSLLVSYYNFSGPFRVQNVFLRARLLKLIVESRTLNLFYANTHTGKDITAAHRGQWSKLIMSGDDWTRGSGHSRPHEPSLGLRVQYFSTPAWRHWSKPLCAMQYHP